MPVVYPPEFHCQDSPTHKIIIWNTKYSLRFIRAVVATRSLTRQPIRNDGNVSKLHHHHPSGAQEMLIYYNERIIPRTLSGLLRPVPRMKPNRPKTKKSNYSVTPQHQNLSAQEHLFLQSIENDVSATSVHYDRPLCKWASR